MGLPKSKAGLGELLSNCSVKDSALVVHSQTPVGLNYGGRVAHLHIGETPRGYRVTCKEEMAVRPPLLVQHRLRLS